MAAHNQVVTVRRPPAKTAPQHQHRQPPSRPRDAGAGGRVDPGAQPQAKGRVERRHGVFQGRFVKALRLRQINTLEAANTYLEEEFLDELNERFHVTARSPSNLHRPVARSVTLDHVLCYQEPRVVQNDWTVSWCNRNFQLGVAHQKLALTRQKILVSELLDGTLRLTWKGRTPTWTEVCTRPSTAKTKPTTPGTTKAPHKPATAHPRRRRIL